MDITVLQIEEHKSPNLVMIITDQTRRNMFLVTKEQRNLVSLKTNY